MDPRLEQLRANLESAVKGMSSEQLSWHLPGNGVRRRCWNICT